jgi:peroxisomal membrane protein 2
LIGIIKQIILNDFPIQKNIDTIILFIQNSLYSSQSNYSLSNLQSLIPFPEFPNIITWYKEQLQQRPLFTKALTSAVLSCLGELVGSYIKTRSNRTRRSSSSSSLVTSLLSTCGTSLRRLLVFFFYGFAISGPFFHYYYSNLEKFVKSLNLNQLLSFCISLTINQLVMTPAFLFVTLLTLQLTESIYLPQMLQKVKQQYFASLILNWKIWTIAQSINFSIIPLDYRVLFGNLVALWWNVILSMITSANSNN